MDYVVDTLKTVVQQIRNMSPLYDDFMKSN